MMDSKVHILAFLGGLRRRDTRREPSLLSSEYTAGMLESIFGVKIVRWNVSSLEVKGDCEEQRTTSKLAAD